MSNTNESAHRIESFMKEYGELCDKHNVELFAAPQFIPSGANGFTVGVMVVPIDRKERGVPSPLNDEIIK